MTGGFFGIHVAPDGSIAVARHGRAGDPVSYAGSNADYLAIQDEIRASGERPHVCIRSTPESKEIAQALTGVRGIRITLVPHAAIDPVASDADVVRFLASLAHDLDRLK